VSSVKVFTNVGRGIKTPTFAELFGGPFADGSAALHPERARTVDAGAEVTFDDQRWLARATVFDNRYRDQVAFRSTSFSGPDGQPDYININGSKAAGAELELRLQRPIGGLTASVTYALVDTEVTSNVSTSQQFQPGQPLLRRPRHTGTVHVTYVNGPASINVDVRRAGERHDSAFLFMSTLDFRAVDITVNPGYTLLGLGADVRLRDELSLYLRIDNLADANYQSALGFPGLPRAVVVGGRFRVGR
jgi:vitamin B12 transporter